MKKLLIGTILAAILMGCSDPKELALPASLDKIEPIKTKLAKLDEEDKRQLIAYLTRREVSRAAGEAFNNPKATAGYTAVTVGDAIRQQAEFEAQVNAKEAEEKALRDKVIAEQKAIQEQVDKALTVAVVTLRVREKDIMNGRYSDEQVIELALKNIGQKDIEGVSGTIVFKDMFDKEVGRIGFQYDEGIKAGQTAQWTGARRINQFDESDTALAQLKGGKYTTRFEAEALVFADGTKLLPSRQQ